MSREGEQRERKNGRPATRLGSLKGVEACGRTGKSGELDAIDCQRDICRSIYPFCEAVRYLSPLIPQIITSVEEYPVHKRHYAYIGAKIS